MSDDVNSSECIGGQHPARIARTTDPAQHPLVFAAAFNSGDPAAVEQLYEGSCLRREVELLIETSHNGADDVPSSARHRTAGAVMCASVMLRVGQQVVLAVQSETASVATGDVGHGSVVLADPEDCARVVQRPE